LCAFALLPKIAIDTGPKVAQTDVDVCEAGGSGVRVCFDPAFQ
jgi:hypothetical protein